MVSGAVLLSTSTADPPTNQNIGLPIRILERVPYACSLYFRSFTVTTKRQTGLHFKSYQKQSADCSDSSL